MHAPKLAGAPTAQPIASFKLARGRAEVFARVGDIDDATWRRAFRDTPKDFAYYQLIEHTMTDGFEYRYLLLGDDSGAAIAIQPLIIATQDLLASAGDAIGRAVAPVRKRWPRFLCTRTLMAGCLVGEGELGVIDETLRAEAAVALAEALDRYAAAKRISLIVLKDYPAADRALLARFREFGYTRIDGFPPLDLHIDFATFEEYLTTKLSKVTRKTLRRKLRQSDAAQPPLKMEMRDNAEEIIDEIYPLYRNVAERSEVAFEVFTREYFLEAARKMPGRFRYFIWRLDGRAVAFSFCTLWGRTLYDNDIGLDYAVAHDRHLYYVTFRDLLEWSIRNGVTRYCSAPFNYDSKLHLRLAPIPVDIYVRHRSRILNALISRIAPFFAPGRSDKALRSHLAAHPAA